MKKGESQEVAQGKVILLNGTSSSGKTTIAYALAELIDQPWLVMGLDFCIDMLPSKYCGTNKTAHNGFFYEQHFATPSSAPIVTMTTGIIGDKITNLVPHIVLLIVRQGLNVIVDEVILDDYHFLQYVNLFHYLTVYSIGITCDLAVLEQRERDRHNRLPGLARGQLESIHTGIRYYDLMLDTTHNDTMVIAENIINFMKKNVTPTAFKEGFMKHHHE